MTRHISRPIERGQSAIDQRAINGLYRGILNVFSPVATNTAEGNFGFVDPMLQVQRQGTILAGAGGAALTVGVGLEVANQSILGRGADLIFGSGQVVGMASSGLTGIGITLLIVGLVMMIVLPLVPMAGTTPCKASPGSAWPLLAIHRPM